MTPVMVNEFSLPNQLNVSPAPTNNSGDSFAPLKSRKISQKNKIIYLSIAMLACAILLIPGVFMVQRVTRLFSQAWEKVNFQSLNSQFPANLDPDDPRLATMSAKLVGRRCPLPDAPQLPKGDVFLFDNETGTVYTYPLAADTVEFKTTVLAGTYYLFFRPETEVQPYFATTDSDHNLLAVHLDPEQTSDTLQLCDSEYISNWLPAELQPGARTDTLDTQREILDVSGALVPVTTEITPATVHGLVCTYGQDVFPAGSVIFYEAQQNNLIVYKLQENESSFSTQVPPGNYSIFFSPQNPVLPIYGFTEYVTCGLDPQKCPSHALLTNELEPAEEYGNIMICDPQYDQVGLPKELTYENK
jgi:hypothetical protein